jgi:hypothetical protein
MDGIGRAREKVRKYRWDRNIDRRKRLSHVGAQGLAHLWGRRFRLPTHFFTASDAGSVLEGPGVIL